jgi:hypothetical protein
MIRQQQDTRRARRARGSLGFFVESFGAEGQVAENDRVRAIPGLARSRRCSLARVYCLSNAHPCSYPCWFTAFSCERMGHPLAFRFNGWFSLSFQPVAQSLLSYQPATAHADRGQVFVLNRVIEEPKRKTSYLSGLSRSIRHSR